MTLRSRFESWMSPRRATWSAVVMFMGLLLLVAWEMRHFYLTQQQQAKTHTAAHAQMVAHWLESALEASHHSLQGVGELYHLSQSASLEQADLATLLKRRRDSFNVWQDVALLSPGGEVVAATTERPFAVDETRLLDALASGQDRMVSPLYHEGENGMPYLLHGLRIENSAGGLDALAVARLSSHYIVALVNQLPLHQGDSVALLDTSARVMVQRSEQHREAEGLLDRAVNTEELNAFLASPALSDSWERRSPLDGTRRLFSGRKLDKAPWLVIVGEDTTVYLHDWWRRFWALLVGTLLLVGLGVLTLRHYRQLYGTEQALREHRNRLAEEVDTRKKSQQVSELKAAQLKIAAMAFETHLGMFIADAENRIVQVNRTFTEITGYSEAEVLGQTPSLLNSGRHDADFYRAMWRQLKETGSWQGEVWNQRKSGEVYPQWLTISVVRNDAGEVTHYVATLSDITQRKAAEQEIHQLAFFDSLTGLPNRRLLIDRLEAALKETQREGHYSAVMFIDLDNFKTINDSLGHYLGDALLNAVAERLTHIVRDDDTVARLGGDEFVVMLHALGRNEPAATQSAEAVAQKLLSALLEPIDVEGHVLQISGSIGITLFHGDAVGVSAILQQADLAMYQAKAAGRNALRFFDPSMQAAVMDRAQLEADLRHVIEREELMLFYQTQVNAEGSVVGVEALVRWEHPSRGVVSPGVFIPLAEENHLIGPVGAWVLETACQQLAQWARDPATEALSIAVNVSPNQFRQAQFVEQVEAVLARTGANPQRLKLEVTETLLMEDLEAVRSRMETLRGLGVRFSLDDFGTGYSSLAYLKRLPLDQLKIDQSFVRDVLEDPADAAIVRTVIALAHSLELEVIAEGVETQAHRDWLYGEGCMAYQGYFFSRPGPADSLSL
ncbi:bifunctional diguanylate cyclase/phosphodiesterase [Vreelandella massiliensis]|uniref:bifunctional diguanylate cyclase/phosphodiesterase n=1 Tax=Vreelandella massiliensis TaxID=1816686 RepID=UPI001181BFDB|nr:EAL domain-containing protein [Halomonas massiliensis]